MQQHWHSQVQLRLPLAIYIVVILSLAVPLASRAQENVSPTQGENRATNQAQVFLPLVNRTTTIGTTLPTGAYSQSFDGKPDAPQRWQPSDWDITVHRRGPTTLFEGPMQAGHGADCSAAPSTHTVVNFDDAVFICNNHMMTSMYAGDYGMIYLTPNQMADFSQGEAVVRWEMSTERTSLRDWVDVWITPYNDNLQLALNDWMPDVNGEPRRAIQIKMDQFNNKTTFQGFVYNNHVSQAIKGNNWTSYEEFLVPDAKRRDVFELRISRNHVKFGMPAYNFWWIDSDIADLGWDSGVVQFGHHSYNPLKNCEQPCIPNTWHWDNVVIAPAKPFTIIRGDKTIISPTHGTTVRFPQPAPANAHLRFTGLDETIEVSFDGGKSWTVAALQSQERTRSDHFRSYWMPVPQGTNQVEFRLRNTEKRDWMVRDSTIWAR